MRVLKTTPLLFFLFTMKVYSLSCYPLYDRIIGVCDVATCKNVLYVEEVGTYSTCGRRPEIIETKPWAVKALAHEFSTQNIVSSSNVFELTIPKRYWWSHSGDEKSFEAYLKLKEGKLNSMLYNAEFKSLDNTNISTIVESWTIKEAEEYRKDILIKLADYASFIFTLGLVFLSIKWFRNFLLRGGSTIYLTASLLIQFSLFAVAFWVLNSWYYSTLVILHFLIIPIVWVYEVIFSIRHRIKTGKS